MSKIDFKQNCLLTRYLEEVSMLVNDDRKAQFAGALLYGLGYPHFNPQLSDLELTNDILRQVSKDYQNDLLLEATDRCMNCHLFDSCAVGTLFKLD